MTEIALMVCEIRRTFYNYCLDRRNRCTSALEHHKAKFTYTYTTEGECTGGARRPRILPCEAEMAGNLKSDEGAGKLSETRPLGEGGGR